MKSLEHSFSCVFEKFSYQGKCYHQVRAIISYERQWVGKDFYNIVKVELCKQNGEAIFAKSMVLITNCIITDEQSAFLVFKKYLKRSKIEGVFKFLKNGLGWEDFQIRNYEAIKNILLLAFFVGAYFCECEAELVDNPAVILICSLAKNKGKVSKHFFMKGLRVLAQWQLIKQAIELYDITVEQIEELVQFLT